MPKEHYKTGDYIKSISEYILQCVPFANLHKNVKKGDKVLLLGGMILKEYEFKHWKKCSYSGSDGRPCIDCNGYMVVKMFGIFKGSTRSICTGSPEYTEKSCIYRIISKKVYLEDKLFEI